MQQPFISRKTREFCIKLVVSRGEISAVCLKYKRWNVLAEERNDGLLSFCLTKISNEIVAPFASDAFSRARSIHFSTGSLANSRSAFIDNNSLQYYTRSYQLLLLLLQFLISALSPRTFFFFLTDWLRVIRRYIIFFFFSLVARDYIGNTEFAISNSIDSHVGFPRAYEENTFIKVFRCR